MLVLHFFYWKLKNKYMCVCEYQTERCHFSISRRDHCSHNRLHSVFMCMLIIFGETFVLLSEPDCSCHVFPDTNMSTVPLMKYPLSTQTHNLSLYPSRKITLITFWHALFKDPVACISVVLTRLFLSPCGQIIAEQMLDLLIRQGCN